MEKIEFILNIIMLHFAIVYVVDFSGFIESVRLTFKPFNCSACTNMWIILFYSLISGTGIIAAVFFGVLLSMLSGLTAILIEKLLTYIENL